MAISNIQTSAPAIQNLRVTSQDNYKETTASGDYTVYNTDTMADHVTITNE